VFGSSNGPGFAIWAAILLSMLVLSLTSNMEGRRGYLYHSHDVQVLDVRKCVISGPAKLHHGVKHHGVMWDLQRVKRAAITEPCA
jgi:hypothetical protein